MCASVQAVPLRIRGSLFYFQPGPGGTGGATSPTTLQCTQPKVDKPKSLLWWANPLKTKVRCENKQRVASLRQSGSKAIFGWPAVWRSASWKRKKKLRLRLFGAAIKTTGSRENIKRTSAILSRHGNGLRRACVHVSVWVTLFTTSDLGRSCATSCKRSRPDRVWSLPIRSDHRPHTLGPSGVPLSWS